MRVFDVGGRLTELQMEYSAIEDTVHTLELGSSWASWSESLPTLNVQAREADGLICRDIFLSLPITILSLLYWYTRQTTAGLHSFGMTLVASGMVFDVVHFAFYGGRSKTLSWEMYVFVLAFSGLDVFEAVMMAKLVLPFEVTWGAWLPTGVRRTGWSKRERNTRRLEGKINWVQRGIVSFKILFLVL